ncbi:MAG: hypothetical protein M0Z54_02630 [Thermaerobacter sp.]|nr:hypothetical protein [Thermaerobacter sp.]
MLYMVMGVSVAFAVGAFVLREASGLVARRFWWLAGVYALGIAVLVVALSVSPGFYAQFFRPFGF